jgi:hypothetical protein
MVFLKDLFFLVKESEEFFEIFLNISLLKNKYSKVIKIFGTQCAEAGLHVLLQDTHLTLLPLAPKSLSYVFRIFE